jgi:hypothetical protein
LDSLKGNFLWTRHALRGAIEDSLKPSSVEDALLKCLIMESGMGKQKAVCKTGSTYCTVIFVKMAFGIKIVTCWKSSDWEIKAFDEEEKK